MQLSTENIEFIMAYLVRQEVAYFDYRIELADHIASEIEEKIDAENITFQEAFLQIIPKNKALIKSKKRISTDLIRNNFIQYFKEFSKPITLLFFVTSFVMLHFYFESHTTPALKYILWANVIFLLPLVLYTFYCHAIDRRISSVEYLFYINSAIHFVFTGAAAFLENSFQEANGFNWIKIFLTLYLTLQFVLLQLILTSIKRNKRIYERI